MHAKIALNVLMANIALGSCGMELKMVDLTQMVLLAISNQKDNAQVNKIGEVLTQTTGDQTVLDLVPTLNSTVLLLLMDGKFPNGSFGPSLEELPLLSSDLFCFPLLLHE